ncbi:hypothetical protein CWB98_00695 [Pseudoalteromonas rubra]|uniref:Uncharacterized protein n=1 Tax=Pseudoalteromonas rubra TaxID=43658 RepID=A0A5S3X5Q9_9GAMM|nr:hypothetical protein CWB98_00695 [Pseudoalteromonas rubra]
MALKTGLSICIIGKLLSVNVGSCHTEQHVFPDQNHEGIYRPMLSKKVHVNSIEMGCFIIS